MPSSSVTPISETLTSNKTKSAEIEQTKMPDFNFSVPLADFGENEYNVDEEEQMDRNALWHKLVPIEDGRRYENHDANDFHLEPSFDFHPIEIPEIF